MQRALCAVTRQQRPILAALSPVFFVLLLVLRRSFAMAADPIYYWNLDKLLSINAQEIELTDSQKNTLARLHYDRLYVLNEIRRRIEIASEVKSDCYIVTGDKPNAFATNITTGRNLFAINIPMLDELG